jgi:hypothetical protein
VPEKVVTLSLCVPSLKHICHREFLYPPKIKPCISLYSVKELSPTYKITAILASTHYLRVKVHLFLRFVQKGTEERGEDTRH